MLPGAPRDSAHAAEGLRALAGRALRRVLGRFTRSPVSGAATGAATTAVLQSSSGTTVTAVLATLGGSVHARRTRYAHAIYNVLTGVGAFFLLVPFMHTLERFAPHPVESQPELVLVGFHSFFNILGVLVALPFAAAFVVHV